MEIVDPERKLKGNTSRAGKGMGIGQTGYRRPQSPTGPEASTPSGTGGLDTIHQPDRIDPGPLDHPHGRNRHGQETQRAGHDSRNRTSRQQDNPDPRQEHQQDQPDRITAGPETTTTSRSRTAQPGDDRIDNNHQQEPETTQTRSRTGSTTTTSRNRGQSTNRGHLTTNA